MRINESIYKMDFEKVNIQELYYSSKSSLEKCIIEIIRIAQKQLKRKQKRIDKANKIMVCIKDGRCIGY